jgi:hypothetical protein
MRCKLVLPCPACTRSEVVSQHQAIALGSHHMHTLCSNCVPKGTQAHPARTSSKAGSFLLTVKSHEERVATLSKHLYEVVTPSSCTTCNKQMHDIASHVACTGVLWQSTTLRTACLLLYEASLPCMHAMRRRARLTTAHSTQAQWWTNMHGNKHLHTVKRTQVRAHEALCSACCGLHVRSCSQ